MMQGAIQSGAEFDLSGLVRRQMDDDDLIGMAGENFAGEMDAVSRVARGDNGAMQVKRRDGNFQPGKRR